ncbi:hypothetical protein ACLF3G_23710, partial [Falsiroseomonas sp. HC035]|uniref:hypothetical protein n=1 Tax=Falsiroseomonas sp. HC035 TaxID=3390999 RepID=UPI003D316354
PAARSISATWLTNPSRNECQVATRIRKISICPWSFVLDVALAPCALSFAASGFDTGASLPDQAVPL